MSEHAKKTAEHPKGPASAEADSNAAPPPNATGTPPPVESAPGQPPVEPGLEQLKDMIAALQDEIDQQKNQTLRVLADMDNLRKRTEREKEDIKKYAITKFAADLINGIDNFERALAAVPAGAAEADPALASLIEGVSMTERELKAILERNGIKRLWPQGEMLNPHFHQAMMEQPTSEAPPGTILQVYQAGYLIEDRVLRAAMVVVAKSAEKKSEKPTSAQSSSKDDPSAPASPTST